MADSFFGFDTSNTGPPLDEGPECMDEEEAGYDALNDETFGAEALEEDWEEDHKKFAEKTEHERTSRSDGPSAQNGDLDFKFEDTSFEARFSNLAESVLDDSDDLYYRVPQTSTPQSKCYSTKKTTHTYSTSAPSGFSLWGPQKGDPMLDPAVLQASSQSSRFVTNHLSVLQNIPQPESTTGSVQTVEELERKLISKNPREFSREVTKQHGLPRLVDDLERELTRSHSSAQELLLRNSKNNFLGGGLAANLLHPASRLAVGRGVAPNFPPPSLIGAPPLVPPRQIPTSAGPSSLQFKPGSVPSLRTTGFADLGTPHLFLPPQLPHHTQTQRLIGAGNVLRLMPPHLQHQQQLDGGKPHLNSGGGFFDNFRGHERYHNNVSNGNSSGYRHDIRMPHGVQNGTNYAQYNGNYGRRDGFWGGVRPQRRYSESGGGDYDEYDGLMTLREQHWLANIQQMQLSTDKPLVDDYYFTVYTIRKQRDMRHDPNSPKDLSLFLERSDRERENGLRMEHRTYTPMQFENSLGKLQVGSVTAPRKIIDLDLLASDNVDTSVTSQRETKKYKQLLIELEWMYTQLLLLEEIDKPLLDPSKELPAVQRSEVMQKISSVLAQEDKLTSFLCIRKGKSFFRRLLPLLGSRQPLLLWHALLRNFGVIVRRDQTDQILLSLYPWFCSTVAAASFSDVTKLAYCLVPGAAQRSASPLGISKTNLLVALGNKLGVSAIVALIDRVEDLYSQGVGEEDTELWSTFISCLVDTVGSVHEIAVPTRPSSSLTKHLSRFSIRIEKYAALEKAFRGLNLKSAC